MDRMILKMVFKLESMVAMMVVMPIQDRHQQTEPTSLCSHGLSLSSSSSYRQQLLLRLMQSSTNRKRRRRRQKRKTLTRKSRILRRQENDHKLRDFHSRPNNSYILLLVVQDFRFDGRYYRQKHPHLLTSSWFPSQAYVLRFINLKSLYTLLYLIK